MPEHKPMTKSALCDHFVDHFAAGDVKLTKAAAAEFFKELAGLAEEELREKGAFSLPGIGKLVVQSREARTGRNPATGEAVEIPARKVVKARIAKGLRDAVLESA